MNKLIFKRFMKYNKSVHFHDKRGFISSEKSKVRAVNTIIIESTLDANNESKSHRLTISTKEEARVSIYQL